MTLRIGVIGTGIMGAITLRPSPQRFQGRRSVPSPISTRNVQKWSPHVFPERRRFHRLNASSNRLRWMA